MGDVNQKFITNNIRLITPSSRLIILKEKRYTFNKFVIDEWSKVFFFCVKIFLEICLLHGFIEPILNQAIIKYIQ